MTPLETILNELIEESDLLPQTPTVSSSSTPLESDLMDLFKESDLDFAAMANSTPPFEEDQLLRPNGIESFEEEVFKPFSVLGTLLRGPAALHIAARVVVQPDIRTKRFCTNSKFFSSHLPIKRAAAGKERRFQGKKESIKVDHGLLLQLVSCTLTLSMDAKAHPDESKAFFTLRSFSVK
jgi:hypothetical protein